MSNVDSIFQACSTAYHAGVPMIPRSQDDKEYFPQDWFQDRMNSIPVRFHLSGRNSYPDYLVNIPGGQEGYEIKSLSFNNGKPARKDYDCNSSLPSGTMSGHDMFLVFFLYTGSGINLRTVHSLCIAHQSLINLDNGITGNYQNQSIPGLGAYGDGFVRDRQMYVFPHPFSLCQNLIGKCSLILPTSWRVGSGFTFLQSINRNVSRNMLIGYSVDMINSNTQQKLISNPDAGKVFLFNVFI